ncbi:mersacidin/lichenicidin family type 2 lantibiotic [Lysinibacillus xylanilyticus]|uniref:mersacidin family lantibiotic n=1 Tax=Lysinibacillus xylanilyticus TaxID=582475 RepID=UPI002B23EFCF|nr:mersacidin/lichenicidin family type 2 lantibiotic [Lysinibacillus xylanilyticus]MEB2300813.1 mersacidin/lichenicidin family type 2 lantibiotic [Lysinibacillus xylanilyticus]
MSNTNVTKEEIIAAWKDPAVREKFNSLPVHPSGKTFGELTEEELGQIQGASDVKPETTPVAVGTVAIITYSIKFCK